MAADHDRRVRARPTSIVPGDLVRILLPRRSHKLAQSYSDLLTVKSVKGNYVTLQNGQRWNLRRCLLAKSSLTGSPADSDPVISDDRTSFSFPIDSPNDGQGPSIDPVRRSSRVRIARDFGPVISH